LPEKPSKRPFLLKSINSAFICKPPKDFPDDSFGVSYANL